MLLSNVLQYNQPDYFYSTLQLVPKGREIRVHNGTLPCNFFFRAVIPPCLLNAYPRPNHQSKSILSNPSSRPVSGSPLF